MMYMVMHFFDFFNNADHIHHPFVKYIVTDFRINSSLLEKLLKVCLLTQFINHPKMYLTKGD